MSSTWELKEKSTGVLTSTIEGDAWKKAQQKTLKKLAGKANLPGFRKGKAPISLIKKQIGLEAVLYESVDEVANAVLSDGINEHNLWIVDRPSLNVEAIDEDKVTLAFQIVVKPEVTLGQYKNLEITKDSVEVTDEDVEAEIKRLQERQADLVLKEDGVVEDGDTTVIDFEGFKDGEPFEGGKAENYPLVIGSGSFIPGFEEQLIGMKCEETKDINVTFPEDYQMATLAGQPVVFTVTVHEIKAKELPEINDDLIKQAEIENVDTVDAYKEYARKNLETSKTNAAEQKFENELLTAITDQTEVEIPEAMIRMETDSLMEDFNRRLEGQGFDIDQFKQVTGQDEDTIREQMRDDAVQKVKVNLVLEAIVAKEELKATEEEINTELENVASTYNMPLEQVKKLISLDGFAYDLAVRKALSLIKETAGK